MEIFNALREGAEEVQNDDKNAGASMEIEIDQRL